MIPKETPDPAQQPPAVDSTRAENFRNTSSSSVLLGMRGGGGGLSRFAIAVVLASQGAPSREQHFHRRLSVPASCCNLVFTTVRRRRGNLSFGPTNEETLGAALGLPMDKELGAEVGAQRGPGVGYELGATLGDERATRLILSLDLHLAQMLVH